MKTIKERQIAFISMNLSRGGAERVMSILANYFSNRHYRVKVILLYDAPIDFELNREVSLYQLKWEKRCGPLKHLKQCAQLRSIVLEEEVLIVFLFNSIFWTILSTLFLKKSMVFSERTDPSRDPNTRIKRFVRNICYLFARRIIFQTLEQGEYFWNAINKQSVVIANPVTANLPTVNNEKKNIIISACRYEKQKNIFMQINAFKSFYYNHQDYKMFIFGNGSLESELRQYIEEIGMSDAIFLKGYTTDIFSRYKEADFFVSSSDYEGISNSMIEAMAMGLPVICTDCPIGGAREIIRDGQNGFLVDVGDAKAMSSYMCLLADDESLRRRIGLEASKIRIELSEDRICRRWEMVVCEALNNK